MNSYAKFGGAARRHFSAICGKPMGGGTYVPPPAVRGLRVGAFYRPGNLLRTQQTEEYHVICDEIRRNFKQNCLIMGDFKLREYEAARSGETNECMVFRQLFEEELFMNQFVTEPTRQRSILDLVFSDNRELVLLAILLYLKAWVTAIII